jgi:hypothetical protein
VRSADNLTTFMFQTVLKSMNLNVLEPSRPVQAGNGIALPLPLFSFFIQMPRSYPELHQIVDIFPCLFQIYNLPVILPLILEFVQSV